jgi:hypothetical protein
MTQTEALRLALEALKSIDEAMPFPVAKLAIKECKAALEAKDEPMGWKLMPRDATNAMLKAMDECAIEGYDERLPAGIASSVYMAAWDAMPEQINEFNPDWDAMAVMVKEQQRMAKRIEELETKDQPKCVAIVEVFGKDWRLDYMALPVGKHKLYAQQYTYTTPPQRTWVGLTDEDFLEACQIAERGNYLVAFQRIQAKLRSKNESKN